MKTLGLLMATALATQAAVLEFDLSPPGTDAAVGLSPLNEVPAVTNSMGTGGELGEGIIYDTESGVLMLNLGYGEATGFINLTGPVTMVHIHGPAGTGESAGVLFPLNDIHFVAFGDAASGGIIQGGVMVESNQVDQLLGGQWYVNFHTAQNPSGEIRGQIIPANGLPMIVCPGDVRTECGDMTTTEIMVSDADGDDVTVNWMVNGVAMDSVVIPGADALTGTNIVIQAEYPLGTNLLEFVATDAIGNTSSCSTTVVVVDTQPPVITRTSADPSTLWPPNHKMVPINVRAKVEDACGEAQWGIVRVTSNEPINGPGDGNTEPDWNIINRHTVELRAERSGNLTGRVYTIWLRAIDASGNISKPAKVEVVVPHDQGKSVREMPSKRNR